MKNMTSILRYFTVSSEGNELSFHKDIVGQLEIYLNDEVMCLNRDEVRQLIRFLEEEFPYVPTVDGY